MSVDLDAVADKVTKSLLAHVDAKSAEHEAQWTNTIKILGQRLDDLARLVRELQARK